MKFRLAVHFLLFTAITMCLFSGGEAIMNPYDLKTYQDDVIHNYAKAVGLPADYSFANGKPVLPLPPINVAISGVMIIGAYPSADFQGGGIPMGNLKIPFDPTVYPHGINRSAEELDKEYLAPLGLTRKDCWITNLVKVFLFKSAHTRPHGKAGGAAAPVETRSNFDSYAKKSLPWLEKELLLAKPKLIITLGAEVAGVVTGTAPSARVQLLDYTIRRIQLGGREYKIVHMVHPGQLMRDNPKWTKIHETGVKSLRQDIRELLKQ